MVPRPKIVASGVAAPRIVGCALAVLVLASCGGPTASPDSNGAASPSGPTISGLPSSTAAPAAGNELKTTAYSYHLPKGWEDITTQLKRSAPGVDTAGRPSRGTPPYTPNVSTLTTPSQISGDPSESDLKSLAALLKKSVAALAPSLKTTYVSIGGAPAVHQEGRASSGTTKFYLDQYFPVHGGNNYGITFAFPPSMSAADRSKVVDPVLASWTFR